MKNIVSLCSICLLSLFISCTQSKTIELTIEMKDGYGPLKAGLRGFSFYSSDQNNPWIKTYLETQNTPSDWTDIEYGDFDTDIYQTAYQNYRNGNISEEWYKELQKSWNWTPDTTSLHTENIKTKIAFVCGKDKNGETKMIIDTNNNLDFSDDKVFSPPSFDMNPAQNMDSLLVIMDKIKAKYERLSNNKVIQDEVLLSVFYAKPYNMWMYNMAKYAVTNFNGNEIAISFGDFLSLSTNQTKVLLVDNNLKKREKVDNSEYISEKEYLAIGNNLYQFKGVNKNRNTLTLEKIDAPKDEIESTQIGFKSIPFEGNIFNSEKMVSLKDYQGKYLLIDFWAIWCGPCLQELPALKKLYDNTDKSKIEFIGIVGDSPATGLEQMIDKYSLNWPQILSGDNNIKEMFHINEYPTSYIIDPKGIIIAKNLRGKALEDKIKELLEK